MRATSVSPATCNLRAIFFAKRNVAKNLRGIAVQIAVLLLI
ncbi:hypothetical protein MY3296_008798 [Beauveria thailandica]